MTDHEQLVLELVNRARLDPLLEVSRNDGVTDLNQGLDAQPITFAAKQPLATIQELVDAGASHAQHMLANGYFSHYSEPDGSTPTDRAAAQGYSGTVGENLAWNGSTGPIDLTAETIRAHDSLFASPSHRQNLLHDAYAEVGVAVETGDYFDGTHTYNAVMLAEEFGFNFDDPYLTGVVFNDSVVDDDFYSIGESQPGVQITAVDALGTAYSTVSGPSGGYNLQLPAGDYTVTASSDNLVSEMVRDITMYSVNHKVDFDISEIPARNIDLLGFSSGEQFWVGESNGATLDTKYYGQLPSTTSYSQFAKGDFNGDGVDDVVARSDADGTLIVNANQDGVWTSQSWGILPTMAEWQMFVGDFNGDGMDDVLGRALTDGTWWVAQSTGEGFQNSYWGRFLHTVDWFDMNVGDFNGDGLDDVAGRASDGTWWTARSTGSHFQNAFLGRWSRHVEWFDVGVGDFNGDGLDDIAGRYNNTYWYVTRSTTDGPSVTEYWGTITKSVTWEDVTIGDFNGDGLDDIAGRGNGQWWIAVSTGEQFTNQYWGYWTTATTWSDVRRIDINGDGRDDLIGRAANGHWWVFQSDGAVFSGVLVARWSPGAKWTHVLTGNFNQPV